MYGVMNGERVKALREERGLSRQQLAERAGIAPATVTRAERGGRVKGATGWKLGKVFGVHPSEIAVRPRD